MDSKGGSGCANRPAPPKRTTKKTTVCCCWCAQSARAPGPRRLVFSSTGSGVQTRSLREMAMLGFAQRWDASVVPRPTWIMKTTGLLEDRNMRKPAESQGEFRIVCRGVESEVGGAFGFGEKALNKILPWHRICGDVLGGRASTAVPSS